MFAKNKSPFAPNVNIFELRVLNADSTGPNFLAMLATAFPSFGKDRVPLLATVRPIIRTVVCIPAIDIATMDNIPKFSLSHVFSRWNLVRSLFHVSS